MPNVSIGVQAQQQLLDLDLVDSSTDSDDGPNAYGRGSHGVCRPSDSRSLDRPRANLSSEDGDTRYASLRAHGKQSQKDNDSAVDLAVLPTERTVEVQEPNDAVDPSNVPRLYPTQLPITQIRAVDGQQSTLRRKPKWYSGSAVWNPHQVRSDD